MATATNAAGIRYRSAIPSSESQSRQYGCSVDVRRDADLSPAFRVGCAHGLGLAGVLNRVTARQQMRRQTVAAGKAQDNLSHLGRIAGLLAPRVAHDRFGPREVRAGTAVFRDAQIAMGPCLTRFGGSDELEDSRLERVTALNCCQSLARTNASSESVQEFLRHSQIGTTADMYVHKTATVEREASELLASELEKAVVVESNLIN